MWPMLVSQQLTDLCERLTDMHPLIETSERLFGDTPASSMKTVDAEVMAAPQPSGDK